MRADDRPAETQQAGPTNQFNPAQFLLSRRGFHRTVLGAAGGLTFGFGGELHEAAAADIKFALPVPTDERSSRTIHIKQTTLTVDPALATSPLDLPVTDVGFNRDYTPWEARNRLGVAVANALIRTHAVTQEYLDGVDFTDLRAIWGRREVPVEPNWSDYSARLDSDEDLIIPIVALPYDAFVDANNVQWLEIDLRKGIALNYVNDANQIFHWQGYEDGPIDG